MRRSLSDFEQSKINNFTVIRILMAWLVLYGHAFALQNPLKIHDPLNIIFKGSTYIGAVAVGVFFLISGYLVSSSLEKRGAIHYFFSRLFRVVPGLVVSTILTVLILGAIASSYSFSEFIRLPDTLKFFQNCFPFFDVVYQLPGVFETNSEKAVNGSLWTLIVELRCYFLLLILGVLGFFISRGISNVLLLVVFFLAFFYYADIPLLGRGATIHWPTLSLYFCIGVLFYVNRSFIILDHRLALLCVLICVYAFGKPWFQYIFPLSSAYVIFYLVYKTPSIPVDDKIGDLSYGIYIYAYPVQGVVAYLLPEHGPYYNILVASLVVIPLAYFSWHCVERPMMKMYRLSIHNKYIKLKGDVL